MGWRSNGERRAFSEAVAVAHDEGRHSRYHTQCAQCRAAGKPEVRRCRGTTLKGVRCSRFTRYRSGYCWEHR